MLSICIPSYNYAQYLPQAIESCLDNTCDIEVVVLDNASTDSTPELEAKYALDKRVRWVRNGSLLPIQENWNKAVSLVTRPWVKLLQADDVLCRGAINRLLEIVAQTPEAHFHGHLAEIIDQHGQVLRRQQPYKHSREPLKLAAKEGVSLKLQQVARLKEPSCNLFRKEAWGAVGGYPSHVRFTFDLSFNVKLMAAYHGSLWSEYLVQTRRHGKSDGATLPAQMAIDDLRMLLDEMLEVRGSPADRRAALGWLQYRVFEVAAQRARLSPFSTSAFVLQNVPTLVRPSGWNHAVQIAMRKMRTGDVQKIIP